MKDGKGTALPGVTECLIGPSCSVVEPKEVTGPLATMGGLWTVGQVQGPCLAGCPLPEDLQNLPGERPGGL